MELKVNVYKDCIYEVEDFLSQEDLQILLDTASTAPESAWFSDDYPEHWNGKTMHLINNGYDSAEKVLDVVQNQIKAHVFNMTDFVQIGGMHRFRVGETLGAHRDNVGDDYANQLGAVVYLNGDFGGGELDYPELDFRLKPKANSLVMHKAHLLHQVLEVTEGVRYTLTTFVAGDETTRFIGQP